MDGSTVSVGWPLAIALALLLAMTVVTAALGRLHTATTSAVAALRASVQLALVAAIILAVVPSWWGTAVSSR